MKLSQFIGARDSADSADGCAATSPSTPATWRGRRGQTSLPQPSPAQNNMFPFFYFSCSNSTRFADIIKKKKDITKPSITANALICRPEKRGPAIDATNIATLVLPANSPYAFLCGSFKRYFLCSSTIYAKFMQFSCQLFMARFAKGFTYNLRKRTGQLSKIPTVCSDFITALVLGFAG